MSHRNNECGLASYLDVIAPGPSNSDEIPYLPSYAEAQNLAESQLPDPINTPVNQYHTIDHMPPEEIWIGAIVGDLKHVEVLNKNKSARACYDERISTQDLDTASITTKNDRESNSSRMRFQPEKVRTVELLSPTKEDYIKTMAAWPDVQVRLEGNMNKTLYMVTGLEITTRDQEKQEVATYHQQKRGWGGGLKGLLRIAYARQEVQRTWMTSTRTVEFVSAIKVMKIEYE